MAGPDDSRHRQREEARRWFAAILATTIMFFDYTMFIFGFASAADGEPIFAGGIIGIAFGLVPVVFFAAATVSNQERSIRTSLLATLLWVVIGTPIAFFDLPTALVAGFGAGGIVALRHVPGGTLIYRVVVVAICVVWVFAVQRISPAAGLMVGAILPFVALTIADLVQERREEVVT